MVRGGQVRLHPHAIWPSKGRSTIDAMTSATHVSIPILCRCLRSFIHLARPGLHRFCWAVEAGTTHGQGTWRLRRHQNRFGAHAGGGDCSSSSISMSRSTAPTDTSGWRRSNQDQNIVDKKFQDNGHMVTVGVNFHFKRLHSPVGTHEVWECGGEGVPRRGEVPPGLSGSSCQGKRCPSACGVDDSIAGYAALMVESDCHHPGCRHSCEGRSVVVSVPRLGEVR